jgi:tetratricopeptide (TPR) repeat protein
MARLDQLGRAREIAQYASVIGQEFSLSLLVRIAKSSIDEVRPHLQALVDSGIVASSDSASGLYHFRHALIRDISYHSLLNRRRKQIHLKIATELEQPSNEPITATDDLVAQHYSLGGAPRQAITFWRRGATEAVARSAHEEALGMLDSAFNDLRNLRGTDLAPVELDLVLTQVMALRWIRGYPSPEFQERLVRARDLCEVTGSDEKRFNVEWGLFQYVIVRSDFAAAHEIAAGLFEHAARHPARPLVDAYLANGMVAFVRGEFEQARELFEKGLDLSRPETDEPHFFTHGQNPGLFCLSYLAQTLCFLGHLDRAKAAIEHSLSIAEARAREPAHIYGHVNALIFAVRVYEFCDDIARERELAEKILDISKRNQYTYYEALSRCHLGWAIGAEGRLSEGIEKMIEGIASLEQTGTSLSLPRFQSQLAELYMRAHRLPEANEALARSASNKLPTWSAEFERLRGDICLLQSHPDPAASEAAYRSSLAIAVRQNARSLMLKTSLSLANLLRRLERSQEAISILERCLKELPDESDSENVRRAKEAIATLTKHH